MTVRPRRPLPERRSRHDHPHRRAAADRGGRLRPGREPARGASAPAGRRPPWAPTSPSFPRCGTSATPSSGGRRRTTPPTSSAGGHQAVPADGPFVRHFGELAAELRMAIAVTYLEAWPGAPRNSVTLIDRHGEAVLTYAKVHTCAFDQPEASLTGGDAFPVAGSRHRGRRRPGRGDDLLRPRVPRDGAHPGAERRRADPGAERLPHGGEPHGPAARSRLREHGRAWRWRTTPRSHEDCDGHSVAFHPCAYGDDGESRDTLVVRAGEDEEICLARFDLDELRAWREREVWGMKYRRPGCTAGSSRRRWSRTVPAESSTSSRPGCRDARRSPSARSGR